MDIDMDPPTSSGVKRPFLPPRTSSQSSAKRAKLDLPDYQLAMVNDQMNTESEAMMWPQILKAASGDRNKMSKLLSMVLVTLVEALLTTDAKATTHADLSSAQAKSLIHGFNPEELKEWEVGLRKAVEKCDWIDLITHPKLRRSIKGVIYPPPRRPSKEQRAKRLHGMFHQTFQGVAHQNFIKALDIYDHIYDPKIHFGRTIPILQSSGTGKSRLVDEIGNVLPTVSICFREGEHPNLGWPPNDLPARRFFLRKRTTEFKGEELAAAFLAALMHILAEKLELRIPSDRDRSPRRWMRDWSLDNPINISESSRYKCFAEVETMAERLLLDEESSIRSARMPSRFPGSQQPADAPLDWHRRLFRLLCLPYFKRLALVLRNHRTKYLVVAFDECSQLNAKERPSDSQSWEPVPYMSLVALQRIIKAYDPHKPSDVTFWFLLLDTNLSIYEWAPSGMKAPSQRLRGDFHILPPWSYAGFNQMVPKNIIAQIKLPSDVLTIVHLKTYGRPYWSMLSEREVTTAAYEKLFPGVGFMPSNVDHVFAAFAIRAGLEIGQGDASERLAIEAVRSHMRILKGVVGSLIITASPSEPILAIAAAEALNESEKTYELALNTLLKELILKGVVIDRGIMGELGSRLLLLLTRDKATTVGGEKFVKVDPETDLNVVQAVRLSTFLQTLLGDDLGISNDRVQQSTWRDSLLQDASDVWINFTHFVQLSIPIDEVTPAMLFEAWSSGFAFQCAFNQAVIDGFMVGYFGKLDQPFNPSNLFVIPWQSKARSEAAALAAPFLATPGNTVRRKPWTVIILMDLAATSAVGEANGPHCDLTFGSAERPTEKKKGGSWKGYAQNLEVEGQRYCLNIRGHRERDYPVIRGLEHQFNQLFQRTLGCSQDELIPFADEMEDAMEKITLAMMTW